MTMVGLFIAIIVFLTFIAIGIAIGYFVVAPLFTTLAVSAAEAIFTLVTNINMNCKYDDQGWRDLCLKQNAFLNAFIESIPVILVLLPGLAFAVITLGWCKRLANY